MKVNSKTMLFEDMTDEEAEDLQKVCEHLVLDGAFDGNARHFFEKWRKGSGLTEDQGLLTMSIAFPQRALLSLVFHRSGALTKRTK